MCHQIFQGFPMKNLNLWLQVFGRDNLSYIVHFRKIHQMQYLQCTIDNFVQLNILEVILKKWYWEYINFHKEQRIWEDSSSVVNHHYLLQCCKQSITLHFKTNYKRICAYYCFIFDMLLYMLHTILYLILNEKIFESSTSLSAHV